MGQNTHLSTYTRGAGLQTYTVNSLSTNQLVVQTGTGTSKIGDVFTVAGVNRVHPETKANSGQLQQFVNQSTNAGGAATWTIAPTPVASGATQNVTALPANGNAITFAGTASTASGIDRRTIQTSRHLPRPISNYQEASTWRLGHSRTASAFASSGNTRYQQ